MKNLLNKTLLRDLQDYKITHRESGNTIYLPTNSVQAFLRMQGGRTHKYKFETPATRKANRICSILDYIVLSSAFTGICLISYNLIVS
jgi:hypothetical protein